MKVNVPIHGLDLVDPLLDRSHDVVVESLMTMNGFGNHVFNELIIDFE